MPLISGHLNPRNYAKMNEELRVNKKKLEIFDIYTKMRHENAWIIDAKQWVILIFILWIGTSLIQFRANAIQKCMQIVQCWKFPPALNVISKETKTFAKRRHENIWIIRRQNKRFLSHMEKHLSN